MYLGYRELLQQIQKDKLYFKDLHIIRFYSSYVAISEGKVISITEPYMSYCPLVESLYRNIGRFNHHQDVKDTIMKAVEEKIHKFGHFTKNRELIRNDIAVPYGASEMLMYAMRKKIIDAAVIVCEGAGTVIVNKPEVIQGIGARMNGVFFTTPIGKIISELEKYGCHVVFSRAAINQIEGVKKAVSLGYKRIAVTINASMEESKSLSVLREIEGSRDVLVTSLAVCATGINEEKIKELSEYADLVWSCASSELREIIACRAIVQISKKIPVFVLTKKGLEFLSGYSSNKKFIRNLILDKQYIISNDREGKSIKMGRFNVYITESSLPVRDEKEPKLLKNGTDI